MDNKLLIQDLAEAIATKEGLTKKKSEAFVKALFETIEEGLLADKFVKIKGLGTFKIITVGERESVNINTGERFSIEGHEKITFTPDTVLKDLVNRPFAHFQTVILNEETDLDELESVDSEQEDPSPDASTTEQDNDNDREEDDIDEVEDTDEQELPEAEANEQKVAEERKKRSEETVSLPTHENGQTTSENVQLTSQTTEKQESLQERINQEEAVQEEVVQEEVVQENTATEAVVEENHEAATVSSNPQPEQLIQETVAPVLQKEVPPTEGKQPAPSLTSEKSSETDATETSQVGDSVFDHPQKEPAFSESQDKPSQLSPMKEENEADELEKSEQRDALHDESQQEIKYIIKELENKRNTWKTISIILLSILLLFLSYFAGYFRWFCPCELMNNKESQTLLCPAPEESDTGTLQNISAETLDSTRVLIQDSIEMEQEVSLEKVEPAPNIKQDVPIERATTQTPEKAKLDLPKERKEQAAKTDLQTDPLESQYNQVPGGRYKIVGTLRTHKIQNGETIRTIALDVYGSKGYAIYIITHNSLENPNMVDTGTVLKLPKLERRK